MQFNSYLFILCFMPIITIAYFGVSRIRPWFGKAVLILGSIFFYTYLDPRVFAVLGISIVLNYTFAKGMEKAEQWRRSFLAIPIAINAALLLYFKYTNFLIVNINSVSGKEILLRELVLPVGISFFTFQQIAYLVAVFRGDLKKADLTDYLVYILYFPKILMGPLVDPVDFCEQLNDSARKVVDWDNIACGIQIFGLGLFKKVFLADTFSRAVSWGFENIETAGSADWFVIMLCYTFEIYFDFSGYSDMAVGASQLLNISLPINFDSPYKAVSVRDFWKRWHISLTQFFTKYIYIPLGGSRCGEWKTCWNTMIVFLISGIWHGANWTFILWGVLHGIFSLFDRLLEKAGRKIFEPVRWIATFGIINILWLLFRSESIRQWHELLKTICFMQNTVVSEELLKLFVIPEVPFLCRLLPILAKYDTLARGFWMMVLLGVSSVICFVPENNFRNLKKLRLSSLLLSAIAFVWACLCLSGESVFVYFNF